MRQPPSTRKKRKRFLVYRKSRTVWRQQTLSSPLGETSYYLCPKCGILLEREFTHYCGDCGQKLDWRIVSAPCRSTDAFL